ncbi:MAG TPA: ASKHA domain-containing protein [Bacillota bacterium]|nr:ASKHA domain-containing protein [Bacillota bacterium]
MDESLYQVFIKTGLPVDASCGGKGNCGRCKIKIREGKVKSLKQGTLTDEEVERGYVLACQSFPRSDLVVEVAEALIAGGIDRAAEDMISEECLSDENLWESSDNAGLFEGNALTPLYVKFYLELPKPDENDAEDDLGRLERGVCKKTGVCRLTTNLDVIRSLPATLRSADWKVTVSMSEIENNFEITGVEPGRTERKYYGIAVDVGTTTVVVHLVDLESGETAGVKGAYNGQSVFGDDVISRIVYAGDSPRGLESLRNAVAGTINSLVEELVKETKIEAEDIKAAVCAGNTTMTHLLLGVDPANIRLEPYTPAANRFPAIKAEEAGLKIFPGSPVLCLPGVASYVGGDTTAGVLFTGMAFSDRLTLFIDVGTNGEMVLGNKDWLVSCACSAGPAFEGVGLKYGMRAMNGAIDHISIGGCGSGVSYTTIGSVPPLGICGSGLIDCIASMRKAGIIDRNGNFTKGCNTFRIRDSGEGKEFVLVGTGEAGCGSDITISEPEVKNLMRSKAAVFAGIRCILKMVGVSFADIDRVIIAGGFGRNIRIKDAVSIGLLPDIPLEKYKYVGNSAVKGAKTVLLHRQAREWIDDIAGRITYIELSTGNDFMEEFISALFIPHTDLNLFPSVRGG